VLAANAPGCPARSGALGAGQRRLPGRRRTESGGTGVEPNLFVPWERKGCGETPVARLAGALGEGIPGVHRFASPRLREAVSAGTPGRMAKRRGSGPREGSRQLCPRPVEPSRMIASG
jgi:hypothetical protein